MMRERTGRAVESAGDRRTRMAEVRTTGWPRAGMLVPDTAGEVALRQVDCAGGVIRDQVSFMAQCKRTENRICDYDRRD
jgi:hypothetical protein